jgi:enoyl-CoA hydratase/carnithine racemase
LLTHAVGPGSAARLLLTGERIDGTEAYRIGLVQQIVPNSELLPTAIELASHIASLSAIAIQRTKYMIRIAQNLPLDVALFVENDSFSYCMTTDDAKEGKLAFQEHRSPRFEGR